MDIINIPFIKGLLLTEHDKNTRDILMELGKRKMVGGQEDMIVDVALDLRKNKKLHG